MINIFYILSLEILYGYDNLTSWRRQEGEKAPLNIDMFFSSI